MSTFENCVPLIRFPEPKSLYEYIFDYTQIYVPHKSLIGKLHQATYSFDKNELLNHFVKPENGEMKEYLHSVANLYNSYGSSLLVSSIYEHAKFLALCSIGYRVLDLISLSLQQQVNNSNWQRGTKFWVNSAISIMPYALMNYAGYNAYELLISSMARTISTYILPTIWSNQFKELDLISSYKNFHLVDIITRNTLYMGRNLLTSTMIEGLGVLFGGDSLSQHIGPAAIDICKFDSNLAHVTYSATLMPIKYIIDELGWMAGKMMVDSLVVGLKSLGLVHDLRNPMRSFMPSKLKQYMGIKDFTEELEQSLTNQQVVQKTNRKGSFRSGHTNVSSFPEAELAILSPISSNSKSITHSAEAEEIAGLSSKVTKRKNILTNQVKENTVHIQKNLLPYRKPVEFEQEERLLAPICGPSIHNINLWGIIGNMKIDQSQLDYFQTSLKAGNIGNRSAIKFLGRIDGHNFYEIRPKREGDRLIGKMITGEEEVYRVIKDIIGYEKAIQTVDNLKQMGKNSVPAADIAVIVFEQQAKHESISKALNMQK